MNLVETSTCILKICDVGNLWEGVMIKVKEKSLKVQAAISSYVACDVPAAS